MGKYQLMFNIDNKHYTGDEEVEIGKAVDTKNNMDIN